MSRFAPELVEGAEVLEKRQPPTNPSVKSLVVSLLGIHLPNLDTLGSDSYTQESVQGFLEEITYRWRSGAPSTALPRAPSCARPRPSSRSAGSAGAR